MFRPGPLFARAMIGAVLGAAQAFGVGSESVRIANHGIMTPSRAKRVEMFATRGYYTPLRSHKEGNPRKKHARKRTPRRWRKARVARLRARR